MRATEFKPFVIISCMYADSRLLPDCCLKVADAGLLCTR